MTPFWNGFLLVTGIVGLIGVLIFAPFCVFDEVFGTDFVEKLLKKLNIIDWNKLSHYQILSEDFIREFKDKIDWMAVCRYQKLSEDFIREFKDKVDWWYISKYQNS